ncbi:hypothetical protein [Sphaerisporangium sp. NPDC051011]|uniref:hypothetical protein n=1 Tax=Sphaerisporangium sp. NPDC051011 TaxID=3155792 RepID=UPI0033F5C503
MSHGFSGTEVEWLASLVGPQGPPGESGEPGSGGAAGIRMVDTGFITSGPVTVTTTFTQLGTDLTLNAAVGDVLEVIPDLMAHTDGSDVQFEAATNVAGTDTNYWSTGDGTSRAPGGISSWYVPTGNYSGPRASAHYTVKAGDLVNGQVTVRFYGHVTGGTRTVLNSAVCPTRITLINRGPIIP